MLSFLTSVSYNKVSKCIHAFLVVRVFRVVTICGVIREKHVKIYILMGLQQSEQNWIQIHQHL